MPVRIVAAPLAFDAAGTPWSPEYGDIYHSADTTRGDRCGQARHVFLSGNDLPVRWAGRDAFAIVELGFGIGLNFLATWQAWRDDPRRCARLHFVSVEKHPFTRESLQALHAPHGEIADLCDALQASWPQLVPGVHRLNFDDGRVTLTLAFADADAAVAEFRFGADAFYLDGFAPSHNPAMWSTRVIRGLARIARAGATAATYTTARAVRDALDEAGFACEKRPGYGSKRDMLAARFAPRGTRRHAPAAAPQWSERRAIVIGAGLAGAAACERLASRGWSVDLIEQNAAPALAASGMHAGAFHPQLSRDDNHLSRLTRAGFLQLLTRCPALEAAGHALRWQRCGALQLAHDAGEESAMADMLRALAYPRDYAQFLTAAEAGRHANLPLQDLELKCGGWWFPQGGWIRPATLVDAMLAATPRLTTHFGIEAQALRREGEFWHALDRDGKVIASAPVVVLANAHNAARFADFALPLVSLRGQVTHLSSEKLSALRAVLTGAAYLLPAIDGITVAGATVDAAEEDQTDGSLREASHAQNLAAIERALPGTTAAISPAALDGRVGFRCAAQDRLPLIGTVADIAAAKKNAADLAGAHLPDLPRMPGLYAACAYSARGLTWAALGGELLASLVEGEPPPLEASLADAIDPGRFVLHRVRRGQLV